MKQHRHCHMFQFVMIVVSSMTLKQSERGYPKPIEHLGIPGCVREEKGWYWNPNHRAPVHYPWHKSPYLEQRKKELQPIIDELDPHEPVSHLRIPKFYIQENWSFIKINVYLTPVSYNYTAKCASLKLLEDSKILYSRKLVIYKN